MLYRMAAYHNASVYGECQHYSACLPQPHDAAPKRQYDYALHHYLSVGGAEGIVDNTSWGVKRDRYEAVLQGSHPAQLVTILRDPVKNFFSRYRYFNLRRKIGTVKEVMAHPNQGDGQTSDIGLHSLQDLDNFMIHEFHSGFFMVLEDLALSLALWKLLCDLPWHEVVSLHVNENSKHPNENDVKKQEMRRGLVEAKHVKDFMLYTSARDKLKAAASAYPNQTLLHSTVDRISRVNTALDDICNVHINSTEYKAEFTGLCTMMSMKPMQFASVLQPDTGNADLSVQIINSDPSVRITLGSALERLKVLTESDRLLKHIDDTSSR